MTVKQTWKGIPVGVIINFMRFRCKGPWQMPSKTEVVNKNSIKVNKNFLS